MGEKKDIFSLISFAGIGNIIPIISLPFLVKLYSAEQFGQVTLYTVFLIFFSNVLSLKYDQAILVSKNDDETISLFISSLSLIIFNSILILGLVLLSSMFFSFKVDNIFLIFIGVIFQSFVSTVFIFHNRNMNIKLMNLANALPLILYVLIALILPFVLPNMERPLVVIRFISLFISAVVLIFGVYSDFSNYSFCKEKLKQVLHDYVNYPKNILPSKLVNLISINSVDLFISIIFGNAILGIYSISRRVVSMPELVISRPLETYFRRKVFSNNIVSTKNLNTIFFKYLRNITILSLFVYLGLIFIVPEILPYIFAGREWEQIIPVITILSLGYTVSFVVVPFMSVFRILRVEKYEMIFQGFFFLAISLLFTCVIVFDLKFDHFLELANLQRTIVFGFCMVLVLKLILKRENVKF
jgi:O-antigen/teichoic acid export membrane protein